MNMSINILIPDLERTLKSIASTIKYPLIR